MLLHFGQRTLKGRCGDFSSSTCKRVEHLWQTMIMSFNLLYESQHGAGIGKLVRRHATIFPANEILGGRHALQ